ncbi:unnamed protein product [Rhizophagus irregularis]|nr:unnamed protein product [Rhizophagus irregularis]
MSFFSFLCYFVPVLWHFGSSVRRSWFFLQQLRRFGNSVPHFSSKVPVLSSATSALWHFGFTHRKKEKEND